MVHKTFSYILSHVSFGSGHERGQFHVLVFWAHLHQDFLKGVEGWSFSINIVLVDLTKGVKQCENNKLLWCHIVYCMQCLRFERNMFKNQRKCNKQKIQCFSRFIWDLLHKWEGFLIFLFANHVIFLNLLMENRY